MSENDEEINTEANNTITVKFELPFSLKERLKDIPEAINYINLLQKQIRKQRKRLKRLKIKLKIKTREIGIQTDNNGIVEDSKTLTEEIKQAAELATQKSGFIYDEVSGFYYDSNTGYYYNAEYGLYYDSKTGIYMTYKQETNTYAFHSQVHQVPQCVTKRRRRKKDASKARKMQRCGEERTSPSPEIEDGECTQSDSEFSDTLSDNSDSVVQWPPCMRIIVEQSVNSKIKIGTLFILTYEGGTLGREGSSHAILLPDINISKVHLKFTYDKDDNHYLVTDLGSRNGTILNGNRISTSKQESDALKVAHGSRIQIGSTVLLCHVHEGNQTCGHCEPGLVQPLSERLIIEQVEPVVVVKPNKSELHKLELKKLRKKFGINQYEENLPKLGIGYTDRAQKRRDTVGSQNPHEKTETASLNRSISSENKGFKMLAKMGWKEGDSLGKDNQGMIEPIPLLSNPGTSGIGSTESQLPENVHFDKNKQTIWKKTRDRFKRLPATTSLVFEDSD